MPTITFSLKDLNNLVGKNINVEDVEKFLSYGKGELDKYDEDSYELTVSFGDTNLPYLWSVEGISLMIKGILGIKHGIKKLEVKKGKYEIVVDKNVEKIRPFINGFVVKGRKIDDYLLKQLIQLQEKFCESYGRKRQKVSIGLYSYNKIKFPIHYKAVEPSSAKFVPLGFEKELNLKEILDEHPKGKEYSWILNNFKKYPLLLDDSGNVLSFPPIINSAETGKIEIGDENIFFEVTGNDEDSVFLAANIFAYAFQERGFEIFPCATKYSGRATITPHIFDEKIRIDNAYVQKVLGLSLTERDIKKILESAGYDFSKSIVSIPDYRRDVMHQIDVVEDLGIFYGYNNIASDELRSYTKGSTFEITKFIDKARELCVGLNYQEIMSAVLSSKKNLYENMNIEDFGTVEIGQYMSETYSVVRTWLVPMLMDVFSKNRHVEFPQRIFEQGIVTLKKDGAIRDFERIALASCHSGAGFTESRQVLDYLFSSFGLHYEIIEFEHSSFIPGRVGRIIVNGNKAGVIGEIHPGVLKNWDISLPVAALEINLTAVFEELNKKSVKKSDYGVKSRE